MPIVESIFVEAILMVWPVPPGSEMNRSPLKPQFLIVMAIFSTPI
jgi:hypothetical protein